MMRSYNKGMISIITPTNKVYIDQKTIDSIKNQSDQDFEWIVIGDGILPLGEIASAKIVIIADNYGPSVARNIGFQVASGDIITYIDNGDEYQPDRIKHIHDIYNEYPFVELLFDSYLIIQEGNAYPLNHMKNIERFNKNIGYVNPDSSEYVKLLKNQNLSIPMGVSHKRKPFVECGGFQRGIVCGEDGILWRRMYERLDKSHIMFTDFNSGNYYVSESGQSRTQRRFDMGGFAFDGSKNDNGKYLDKDWFETYSSKGLYDTYEN